MFLMILGISLAGGGALWLLSMLASWMSRSSVPDAIGCEDWARVPNCCDCKKLKRQGADIPTHCEVCSLLDGLDALELVEERLGKNHELYERAADLLCKHRWGDLWETAEEADRLASRIARRRRELEAEEREEIARRIDAARAKAFKEPVVKAQTEAAQDDAFCITQWLAANGGNVIDGLPGKRPVRLEGVPGKPGWFRVVEAG